MANSNYVIRISATGRPAVETINELPKKRIAGAPHPDIPGNPVAMLSAAKCISMVAISRTA